MSLDRSPRGLFARRFGGALWVDVILCAVADAVAVDLYHSYCDCSVQIEKNHRRRHCKQLMMLAIQS